MNTTMTETAFKVLTSACQKSGAASYLFAKELAYLEQHGLIVRVNEHKFIATDDGRRTWLLG
jgi:hypothetical protein